MMAAGGIPDRTAYLIAWYTAADESGAASLDQEGIKKLTAYNENLFFRILSAHIAQDKDKSIETSNNYIKLCLRKIAGGNGAATTFTSPSPQTSRQQAGPQTGTTGAAEAERRKNLLGGFRPKAFGGFPTTASTPYNAPPAEREPRNRRPEVRSERTQTTEAEPENEPMDLGLDDLDMEDQPFPFHNMGPRDPEVMRWNKALDRALHNVNDQLQSVGVQVDLVERGQTVGAQTDYDQPTRNTAPAISTQTDLRSRDLGFSRDIGTQNPHFDASTSVEIGHLPNNQGTFSVLNRDLDRAAQLGTQTLDYLPDPGPVTAVIDRDVPGERQIVDIPDVLGEPGAISRIDAPTDYPDLEPNRLEDIAEAIPLPAEDDDDIQITSSLLENEPPPEENLHVDVLPQPGESENDAVERVVRPILDEYEHTPPSSGAIRMIVGLERNRRLAKWRATHPIQPIHLEPGLEVRKLVFPRSGDGEFMLNLHPPNVGVGTEADPFIHAASEILREHVSDPLETSHIVFEPNVDLEALPGSHTQPRDVIFHIPGPNGSKLVRPTSRGNRLESIISNLSTKRKATTQPALSAKFARPNDDVDDDGTTVRIFRKEHLPTNEVELVFNPAPNNTDPFTGDALTPADSERAIRQRQIHARRIRASNNEADALFRILKQNNTPTGRALVPGVKYTTSEGRVFHGPPLIRPDVEIVAPTREIVNIAPKGFFDAQHRTNLLRTNLLRRKLYPARKLLAAQRSLAEKYAADGHGDNPADLHAEQVSAVFDMLPGESFEAAESRLRKVYRERDTFGNMLRNLERQTHAPTEAPDIPDDVFNASARRIENEYQQRRQRRGKPYGEQHIPSFRMGKGLAIHHAAKTIFGTLMNPSTSDERFNLNVRMLNQVTKHWPPQPAHDTITNWSQIFAQNPRGQTLTVDPYERQLKINSLFKLVHGPKNKLYPHVSREEMRRGAGSKHHAREPHIICPDESAKHYRDRRTLGKERLSRVLPDECFYHPMLSFGGEFLNRVC